MPQVKDFKIKGEFDSLKSPREYNFATDRIFIKISENEIARIFEACDKKKGLMKYALKISHLAVVFIAFMIPILMNGANCQNGIITKLAH